MGIIILISLMFLGYFIPKKQIKRIHSVKVRSMKNRIKSFVKSHIADREENLWNVI